SGSAGGGVPARRRRQRGCRKKLPCRRPRPGAPLSWDEAGAARRSRARARGSTGSPGSRAPPSRAGSWGGTRRGGGAAPGAGPGHRRFPDAPSVTPQDTMVNQDGDTGLALLAFLGAGYTHESAQFIRDPKTGDKISFGEAVKKGFLYLIHKQEPDGSF